MGDNIGARDVGPGGVAGGGSVEAENIVHVNVGESASPKRGTGPLRPPILRIAERLVAKLDNGFTMEEILRFRDECETPEERDDVAFIAQMKNTRDIGRMRERMDRLERLMALLLVGMPILFVIISLVIAGLMRGG